jgi:hypothetical protein
LEIKENMPQFTAINGLEAKAIILDRISKALDESGDFSQNITYPWWKFSFELKMTSYPKAAFEAELAAVAKVEESHEDPENVPPSLDDVKETIIAPEPVIIDTPDQARVDAGLPLPTAVPVKNVGIVDAPVMQAPKAKKGK